MALRPIRYKEDLPAYSYVSWKGMDDKYYDGWFVGWRNDKVVIKTQGNIVFIFYKLVKTNQ